MPLLLPLLLLQTAQAPPPVPPETHANRSVTFHLRAPKAQEVAVAGDFSVNPVPMKRGDDGVWSGTTAPLETGLWFYRFTVDGLTVADPGNPRLRTGAISSILEVRGADPLPEDVDPSVPRGTLRIEYFRSATLNQTVQCYIYTPPGYDDSAKKYPVLYLLHGGGGGPSNWTASGYLDRMADNYLARGRMKEMIVVMPFAEIPRTTPITPESRLKWLETFETYLVNDVLPWAEKKYRILGTQPTRWLAGLSNGGSQTFHTGFRHPDLFSALGIFSTGVRESFEQLYPAMKEPGKLNRRLRVVYFACGSEDGNFPSFRRAHATLDSLGVKHDQIVSPGGHTWHNWRRYLAEFLPRL